MEFRSDGKSFFVPSAMPGGDVLGRQVQYGEEGDITVKNAAVMCKCCIAKIVGLCPGLEPTEYERINSVERDGLTRMIAAVIRHTFVPSDLSQTFTAEYNADGHCYDVSGDSLSETELLQDGPRRT